MPSASITTGQGLPPAPLNVNTLTTVTSLIRQALDLKQTYTSDYPRNSRAKNFRQKIHRAFFAGGAEELFRTALLEDSRPPSMKTTRSQTPAQSPFHG